MHKIFTTTAVALALAAAVPAAYAQTSTSDTRGAATVATTSTMIQPDEVRASKFIGSTVYDVQNRNIGSVKDLVLDNRSRARPARASSARTPRARSGRARPA
jgi:hypothetical protein